MKKYFIIFLIIFIKLNVFAVNINTLEINLIKKIPDGIEEGMLKLEYMPKGPTCFYYYNFYYYVCDNWNNRIVVFDEDFNFIKNIKSPLKKRKFSPEVIKVDDEFIYFLTVYDDFYKLNYEGEIIFNKKIDTDMFYILNKYIIYYDNSNRIVIDPYDNILTEEKVDKFLDKREGWHDINLGLDSKKKQEIKDFIERNKLLYKNGKILNREFKYSNEYFKIINNQNIQYDPRIFYLLGYDNNQNSYWYCESSNVPIKTYITVINKKGVKLISFESIALSNFHIITKTGTVIIMHSKDDGTYFYRIQNTWDPIDLTQITTKQIIIKQFTQTSWLTYDKDWYMYHTIKAFDGKPATGWIDGSKGSGIGDYIGFMAEKEITIDEIKIMPGYFDKRWWKDNNRIKKLEIVMDNERITASFQDKMEKQSIKLNEEIRFKNIKFIIKDVYKAAKDDDTAIAEIEFYHKGEKLTLDYKKLEYYLLELSEEQALRVEEEEIPQQVAAIKEFSYKNYLIEYSIDFHPVAAFDDIVNTAWIENSKGHGIDDYLGVEFENEIIVDKIIIYPGYFSGNDFKRSNRVKKILIELNGNKLEKTFVDEAMGQDIVFENPITFKKIKLTIKDVYKSGVYDQTAISEVRFYYNGKKIKIDTSKYAEYLK